MGTVATVLLLVVVALVVGVGGLVVFARLNASRSERKLRDDVRAYVEKKGGTVTFDDADGMTVEGSLGSGHQKLTALRIMLSSASNRDQVIGFALRKYLPDAFDAIFEKNAEARLDAAAGVIGALAADDLRGRVRVRVVSTRRPHAGLATCARPVAEGFEARVVLDGFDLDGIPEGSRAKLAEDDATLFETALEKTLGAPPAFDAFECESLAWLASPARVFGPNPAVIGAVGEKLAWVSPAPDNASRELAAFVGKTLEDGPMKGVVFGWAGAKVVRLGLTVHSVKGPDTPDFTLDLPPVLCQAFGLAADASGSVALRR